MPDEHHKKHHHENETAKDEDIANEETVEEEEKDTDEAEDQKDSSTHHESAGTKGNALKRFWHWLLGHKMISIPIAVVVLLLLLAAVPFTRYGLAGLVVKQNVEVVVTDSQTSKPVSSATVSLGGKKTLTDNEGKAKLRVPVGESKLVISKPHYKSGEQEIVVGFKKQSPLVVKIVATGRQVPVAVVNKISGKPIENITIAAEGTQVKTDKKGKAILVLAANKTEVKGKLHAEGYNDTEVVIKVTTEDSVNAFSLTPSGKIYFMSNASGKLDLVKTNLDGTDRQTVLAGTGNEARYQTVLLASRDWKYIALLSKRDTSEYAKLFLIETGSDKVTTMDEGEATFYPYGWSGDRFIYKVARAKVKGWEPKREALKSYHAPTKKITALAETGADGYEFNHATQFIDEVYILNKDILYTLGWGLGGSNSNYFYIQEKQPSVNSVRSDGSQKKTLKNYPSLGFGYGYLSVQTKPAEFGEIYIQYRQPNGETKYDEYEDGKIIASDWTSNQFNETPYPVFVVSPSDQKTLWSEYRDGKNVFFVGDAAGKQEKQVGLSEDYATYGWFTDDYILLTRKGSELRILPASGLDKGVETSLKISDYYKPDYYIRGYGYGYGG